MTRLPPHRKPLFEVRHSRIHGYGVFALRRIRKGTTVIEYLGDRVSHTQANERYEHKDPKDGHTFLFTVDAKTVIDAGVDGNEARFVNHGCDPNCQTVNTNKRIFIEALRTIEPGEELAYDYQIGRDDDDPADVDVIFACRCGAMSCRGSMLEAPKKKRKSKSKPKLKRESKLKRRPKNKPRQAHKRKAARKPAR
ncbi:MAG: SET domain-containing protein-lysine N-methyltransferase [Pseudomonadota bacterium]|nr:SET domain-containing protein-lysine N-methyltransferase [Pseudomonadota bacterium]